MRAIFSFDHLVHYVERPNDVVKRMNERGIHTVIGGEHQNRPTYNALAYFDLSYIEFIGTSDKKTLQQMEHPPHSMIRTIINNHFKEGFMRFVLRTDDIEGAAERFKQKGLDVTGPVYLSRERPDGKLLEWHLLFIGDDDELELPYIIEWNESDAKRRKDLIENDVIRPTSSMKFSHITIAVRDLEEKVSRWSDLFGLEAGKPYYDEHLKANCQSLKLAGTELVFSMPDGPGFLADLLEKHGEKPVLAHIHNAEQSGQFELFGGIYRLED